MRNVLGTIHTSFVSSYEVVRAERRNPIEFGLFGKMSKSTMTLCCETLWARYKLQYAHDHSQNVHVFTCIIVAHDESGDPN